MQTKRIVSLIALAAVLATGVALLPLHAQDSSVQAPIYRERTSGLYKDQGGGSMVLHRRARFTIAQVNAGATLLPIVQGYKYRMVDAAMIAVGGAVATCDAVTILGTQATSGVALVTNAVAALTENALLRAGASNSVILAAGASFVTNDVSKAITVGKTGGTCATATHVDVLISYVLEQ